MPFAFRLATILRLRRSRESEAKLLLAGALRALRVTEQVEADLRERAAAVRARYVERLTSGSARSEDFVRQGLFSSRLSAEIQNAAREVQARQADVQTRRADLANAARQRETLERLRDKHRARFRKEQDRKDARLADELYLARYGRRIRSEPAIACADEDAFT